MALEIFFCLDRFQVCDALHRVTYLHANLSDKTPGDESNDCMETNAFFTPVGNYSLSPENSDPVHFARFNRMEVAFWVNVCVLSFIQNPALMLSCPGLFSYPLSAFKVGLTLLYTIRVPVRGHWERQGEPSYLHRTHNLPQPRDNKGWEHVQCKQSDIKR